MTNTMAIIRCDSDGMVTDVLHAGGTLADLIRRGRPIAAVVVRRDFRKALDFIATVRRDRETCNWEMALAGNPDDVVYRFSGGMSGDDMTVAIVSVNRPSAMAETPFDGGFDHYESLSLINNDLITTQRELAKTIAKLQAANEQKNRVMGILAHDLRNPLNAIIGFSSLLELVLAGRSNNEEISFLAAIRESGRNMVTLIEDTLSMSTFEAGQMRLDLQTINFGDLTAQAAKLLTIMAERKGVKLILDQPEIPALICADTTKIIQVLNNLIANAIKFSHSKTEVHVTVSTTVDQQVRLTIADQGTGIPSEVMTRLFEPFTKGRRMGTAGESTTGLGLYICRNIVTAHGGTISVASDGEHGTSVTVNLPRVL